MPSSTKNLNNSLEVIDNDEDVVHPLNRHLLDGKESWFEPALRGTMHGSHTTHETAYSGDLYIHTSPVSARWR